MNDERSREDKAGREPNEAATTLGQSKGTAQGAADMPPAGPHANPSLVNPDATPGAGTLPPAGPLGDDETDQATS